MVAIASAPPSVSSVLAAVLPRSITHADSQSLLQGCDDLSLPAKLQWLALESWLHSCATTVSTAQGWDDVKGLVEACYHGCQLQEWELVYQLVSWPVGQDQRPLYDCLETWGQHQSQIAIFEDLKGKLGDAIDLLCLDKLGHAYRYLGNYAQAQHCHDRQLKLAQRLGDRSTEMAAYWGLCNTYTNTAYMGSTQQWHGTLGVGKMARSYCQRYSALANQLEDTYHQARALYQWGRTYRYQIGYKQGIPFLKRALDLIQTLPTCALEVRILIDLGSAHFFARHYAEAQRYLQAAISPQYHPWRAQEPDMETWATMLLSFADFLAGNREQGRQKLKGIMANCHAMRDVSLEIFALHNITVCLTQYNLDRDAAIEYGQKALELGQRLGFLRVVITNAANLAVLHSLQHNPQAAQANLQQAIALYRNYHRQLDREEKGIFFAYTAHVYWLQGQRLQGLFNLGRSLIMLPPWSSVNGQLIWRKAVATLTPPFFRALIERITT